MRQPATSVSKRSSATADVHRCPGLPRFGLLATAPAGCERLDPTGGLGMAALLRERCGGSAVLGAASRVCPGVEQQTDEILVSVRCGRVKRRVPATLGGIDVGPSFEEEGDDVAATSGGRAVDRAQPCVVGGKSVRIGSGVEQQSCGLRITTEEGGEVQRGETVVGRGARQLGRLGERRSDAGCSSEGGGLEEVELAAFRQRLSPFRVTAVEGGEDR